MSDEQVRELERRWQETGSPADEAAWLRALGRARPELHGLHERLEAWLVELRRAVIAHAEQIRLNPMPTLQGLAAEITVARLLQTLVNLEEDAESERWFAQGRLYAKWPPVFVFAVRDREQAWVSVRLGRGPSPGIGSTWPSLGAWARVRSEATIQKRLAAWLEADEPDRVVMPRADAQLVRRVREARGEHVDPNNPPATERQRKMIERLRRERKLEDYAAWVAFLAEEGWFQPPEALTKLWASCVIDALEAPDEIPDDLPYISTDPDYLEPTDKQVDYLRSLKKRLRLDLAGLHQILRGIGVEEPVDRITKMEMSLLIDALKARTKR